RQLLNEVTRLDEEAAKQDESGAEVSVLVDLHSRLTQLRNDALDRFTEGELNDTHLMASLLAHVAAARENVTRLIAQRRSAAACPWPRSVRDLGWWATHWLPATAAGKGRKLTAYSWFSAQILHFPYLPFTPACSLPEKLVQVVIYQ